MFDSVETGRQRFGHLAPVPVRAPNWRTLYLQWYDMVERAYARLGHSLGFNPPIVSSVRAFEAAPRLLLLGLNPAGSRDYPEHRGRFRFEEQDAYLGTSWDDHAPGQAPLQRQIGRLLGHVQRRLGESGPLDLFALNRVVSASLVPFRSPGEAALHRRSESLEFGRQLWREIFSRWRPKYAVCFGTTPFRELVPLLGQVTEAREYDPCWQGSISVRVLEDGTRVAGFPHLSRFQVFGRPQSAEAIERALDDLLDGERLAN